MPRKIIMIIIIITIIIIRRRRRRRKNERNPGTTVTAILDTAHVFRKLPM